METEIICFVLGLVCGCLVASVFFLKKLIAQGNEIDRLQRLKETELTDSYRRQLNRVTGRLF